MSTICPRMGELNERKDSQKVVNIHCLSHQAEPDRATSKRIGSETHHSPFGPPTLDMDIKNGVLHEDKKERIARYNEVQGQTFLL
jgi:hypothetical protein